MSHQNQTNCTLFPESRHAFHMIKHQVGKSLFSVTAIKYFEPNSFWQENVPYQNNYCTNFIFHSFFLKCFFPNDAVCDVLPLTFPPFLCAPWCFSCQQLWWEKRLQGRFLKAHQTHYADYFISRHSSSKFRYQASKQALLSRKEDGKKAKAFLKYIILCI